MRQVYVYDGEVILGELPPRREHATITRERRDGAMIIREVSTDGGCTWLVDARYYRGTSATRYHAITSEEL